MSEDGHKYFFGQMPEMPWKRKENKMHTIEVNGKETEISDIAYQRLLAKTYYDGDGCLAQENSDIGWECTCKRGHRHPHIASGISEVCAVWVD